MSVFFKYSINLRKLGQSLINISLLQRANALFYSCLDTDEMPYRNALRPRKAEETDRLISYTVDYW